MHRVGKSSGGRWQRPRTHRLEAVALNPLSAVVLLKIVVPVTEGRLCLCVRRADIK